MSRADRRRRQRHAGAGGRRPRLRESPILFLVSRAKLRHRLANLISTPLSTVYKTRERQSSVTTSNSPKCTCSLGRARPATGRPYSGSMVRTVVLQVVALRRRHPSADPAHRSRSSHLGEIRTARRMRARARTRSHNSSSSRHSNRSSPTGTRFQPSRSTSRSIRARISSTIKIDTDPPRRRNTSRQGPTV